MSWLLISDGVSTVANFTSVTIPANEDFTIRIVFRPDSTAAFRSIIGQNGSFDNSIALLRNGVTNCQFTFGATNYIRNYSTSLVVGTVYDFEIQRVSGVIDMVDTATQLTVISSAFTDNTAISFDKLFKSGGGTSGPFDGGLGLFQITNATINHTWDATASSHAAGSQPTLTDTISSNNALGVNFATDGSAWVNLGGGGVSLTVPSIPSEESFGNPTVVNLSQVLGVTSIASLEAFGLATIVGSQVLQPSSISSLEALGEPVIISGAIILEPSSIGSQELLGTPSLVYAQLVSVTGINSEEAFGLAIVQDGIALVIPVNSRATYQAIQAYLRSTDKFVSVQNNGIIVEWLRSEGITEGAFNNMFNDYWESKGFTGAYNDRWKKWKDS